MEDNLLSAVIGAAFDPFQYGFMARALFAAALVGLMAPVVGCYVVTRGLGFMGDALAHAVLPGIAAALLIGAAPLWGAVPAAIASALLIGYIAQRTGLSEDAAIGILLAGLFALGLSMLSIAGNVGVNASIEDTLLGQALGVSRTDIIAMGGLAAVVFFLLRLFHKKLVFISFDRVGAEVAGIPTRRLDYLLLALIAVVIVIALQSVGIVLVIGMLIIPAATALLLVRSFAAAMACGAAIGTASAVTGIYLSFYMNLPSGPAMTLAATAAFIVAATFRRRIA